MLLELGKWYWIEKPKDDEEIIKVLNGMGDGWYRIEGTIGIRDPNSPTEFRIRYLNPKNLISVQEVKRVGDQFRPAE